ncbi:hypothetical protein PA05_2385 [Cutibacterium acnes P05]|nr:hypothetical protein [Cutibacterium acnes P05]
MSMVMLPPGFQTTSWQVWMTLPLDRRDEAKRCEFHRGLPRQMP